ncbi:hypothetical protein ACFFRR_006968 [Megaselia abdita]
MEEHKADEELFLQNQPIQETFSQESKPHFLQKLVNIKFFVFFYAIAGCFFAASNSYFNGIVTTLEKRFKIPSRNVGIIMSAVDIVNVFGSWFISYYGGRQHRPRLMAVGLILLAAYNSLVILPHLIYGPGNVDSVRKHENTMICGLEVNSNCIPEENSEYSPQIIFFIAHFIYGCGDTIYWILGTTFVDDNSPKALAPLFMSISSFGRFLGPSLGLSLASVCLKYFVSPENPPEIEHTDPRWIGAWWVGGIVLIIALIIPTIVIGCFPKAIKKQGPKESEPQTMKSTLQRLLKNKMIIIIIISSIFHAFAFGPFWTFTPKYIEIQFKQSPETSNMVVGSLGIVSLALGIIFSGGIMSCFKPKTYTIMRTNIFLGVLSIFLVICYSMLGCDEAQKSFSQIGDFDCNMNCGCEFAPYSPMCGADQKTYISPCHAGCSEAYLEGGQWSYRNCSCVPDGIESGSCPVDCERSFKIYIVVLCLFKFLIAAGRGFMGLVFMRAVEERDKTAAMGFFASIGALFSFIPIPIFYGWLYDNFCLVWGTTCSSKGNCWLYDAENLRFYLCAVSLFSYVIGLVLDAMATRHSHEVKCFDEH